MLTLLILQRQAPLRRQQIAFQFWPESSERQAQTNLRQALFNLRRALPDPDAYLQVDATAVRWRPDAPATIDVVVFDAAAAEADRRTTRDALERAVSAYGGDLLPGCYEDWIEPERERLRQTQVRLLEQLSDACESQGDGVAAIRWSQQLLHLDPLHEASYRRLMRVHVELGERAPRARAYHSCASALERELGVLPEAATVAAYESLVAGDAAALFAAHGEPVRGPALVGHDAESQRLQECLRAMQKGSARFVLVSGEAGIGKSRLVEDFRAWCARGGSSHNDVTRAYEAEGDLSLRSRRRRPCARRRYHHVTWSTLEAGVAGRDQLTTCLNWWSRSRSFRSRPRPVGEEQERTRLFEALARAVTSVAGPLLMVFDDLQWCDVEDPRVPALPSAVRPTSRAYWWSAPPVRRRLGSGPLTSLVAGLRALDTVVEQRLGRLDPPTARLWLKG